MFSTLIFLTIFGLSAANPQRNLYLEQNERPGPGQLQAYVKFSPSDIRNLKTKGYALPLATAQPNQIPSGFRTVTPTPTPTTIRRPIYDDENYPVQNSIAAQNRPQQQYLRRPIPTRQELEAEAKQAALEEEEKEEPDRLTVLLPNSKFDCSGRNTGYYADEGLECEVFHYCQENVKHSWICPEGFTFHQVHLICMPPGADNICAKSSQFHFVNDYLYKPLNLEEAQSKPNVTLRYSDRYYPESYYEQEEDQEPVQRKQPIQIGFRQQQQQQQQQVISINRNKPIYNTPTFRPETQYLRPTPAQVFRSAEEVNISLQQRRPLYVTQRAYQQPTREEIQYE